MKNSMIIFMFLLIIGLAIGLNIYLPWRLSMLLALQNPIWLYILFAVGFIGGLTTMFLITKFDNIVINTFYNVTWTWLGMLLFLICLMIIFEIVNLIFPLPPLIAGWTIIALTVALSAFSMINASSFKVNQVNIPIKNLENEVKIAQISDLHLGVTVGKNYLIKIVNKINELNPDFVVITGDLTDSKAAFKQKHVYAL
jgi:hypothetical protein